jgi:hypothetical protein
MVQIDGARVINLGLKMEHFQTSVIPIRWYYFCTIQEA